MSEESHRGYVGGYWDEIGEAQFKVMKDLGLKPTHKFLDIGCGSFRGGRFFIDYLDSGNYYGIDRHRWLIDAGIKELHGDPLTNVFNTLVDENFSFSKFGLVKFDYVLAKSVFTHLLPDQIRLCFNNLRDYIQPYGIFYATIFQGPSKNNPKKQSDRKKFAYMIDEIKEFAGPMWHVDVAPLQIRLYEPRSRQTLLEFRPN